MARRITVVLSQSARPNPTQRDLEGTLVAELLMVHGLEVTLVPDLSTLDDGDTGMLCLEGISTDMVMLSWMPPVDALSHLRERGIGGRAGRTSLGAEPALVEGDAHPRTIFCIDLHRLTSVQACCDEIHRIREEATVTTYDLGISPIPTSPSRSADVESTKSAIEPPVGNTETVPHAGEQDEHDADDDEELDRLMDELDAWDK